MHHGPARPHRAFLALIAALALVVALAACGGPPSGGGPDPDPDPEPDFVAIAQFRSPESRDGDRFGTGLALQGDVLLAGAPYAAGVSSGAAGAGAAWPYLLGGTPNPGDRFASATGMNNDEFGRAVALDGGYAFVGSPGEEVGTTNTGGVFVYLLESGEWTLVTRLYDPVFGTAAFGNRIAAHGGRVLITSPRKPDGLGRRGIAHVFELEGDDFLHRQTLRLPDGVQDEGFGAAAVALRGDVAVVTSMSTHQAYVYEYAAGSWSHRVTLGGEQRHVDRQFGRSAAVGNGVLFIGAPAGVSPDVLHGEVFVYARGASTWTQAYSFSTMTGNTAWFGHAVATDGERLVVGAPTAITNGLSGSGAAFTYDIVGTEVSIGRRITALEPAAQARFGTFVAIDGDRVAVAAPNRSIPGEPPGEVVVFER